MLVFILSVTILFQFSATILSLHLITTTGKKSAWILITIALALMGLRGGISLYQVLTTDSPISTNLTAELFVLSVSLIILVGVILIGPIFNKISIAKRNQTMVNQCNDALVHILDEEILLNRISTIIVETGGYCMAGVGILRDDEKRSVDFVASHGDEKGYFKLANIALNDKDRGHGPVGISIRNCKPYITKDIATDPVFTPWREAAIQRDYASCAALPLIVHGAATGVLLIYSKKKDVFYNEEVELLQKLADNLAFGINVLQLQADQKRTAEELRKLSLSVQHSPNIIMITNKDAVIEYVNPKFTDIMGYTFEEAMGKSPDFFISDEITSASYEKSREIIRSGKTWRGEYITQKKNGDSFLAAYSVFAILNKSEEITNIVSIHEDITEKTRLSEQLTYQASHDDLTGLINRREFERRTKRLLSTDTAGNKAHALCYFDLDQFKVVNDTCGHIAGDELLRQLASMLEGTVRKRDTLARLGGDEFGVLMEHCSVDSANRVAMSLHKAIQDYHFQWEGHFFKIGVSIGLVPITNETIDLTQLLQDADSACYIAKEAGRNRIHIHSPEDSHIAKRHGEMIWVERILSCA